MNDKAHIVIGVLPPVPQYPRTALGIAGALAFTRVLSHLLFEVQPTDPLTFLAVSLTLFAVAAVACFLPARRATAIQPMIALRSS